MNCTGCYCRSGEWLDARSVLSLKGRTQSDGTCEATGVVFEVLRPGAWGLWGGMSHFWGLDINEIFRGVARAGGLRWRLLDAVCLEEEIYSHINWPTEANRNGTTKGQQDQQPTIMTTRASSVGSKRASRKPCPYRASRVTPSSGRGEDGCSSRSSASALTARKCCELTGTNDIVSHYCRPWH